MHALCYVTDGLGVVEKILGRSTAPRPLLETFSRDTDQLINPSLTEEIIHRLPRSASLDLGQKVSQLRAAHQTIPRQVKCLKLLLDQLGVQGFLLVLHCRLQHSKVAFVTLAVVLPNDPRRDPPGSASGFQKAVLAIFQHKHILVAHPWGTVKLQYAKKLRLLVVPHSPAWSQNMPVNGILRREVLLGPRPAQTNRPPVQKLLIIEALDGKH
mmetsp:Transcript_67645/g.155194  ORF Transcript_67645/g.155194 Transcript_67645/m.155194 type:complete len:212 (-) Transcript_67645:56-691(-)